jgi:undecaprenyl-diphosphatase
MLLTATLIALVCCVLILLVLTLLDHRLDLPAVQHFDLTLQARIHSFASPSLTRIMLALTWIGSIKIFLTALAVSILYRLLRHGRHDAILLAGSILGALVLNQTLKLHFHRLRPQVPWSIGDEHTFSFPSGHSLFSVVLYGALAWCALHRRTSPRRRLGVLTPAILMPLTIGLSRIYLGMHFPTDVLAGWLTGGLWLAAVISIDRLYHRQRHQEFASSHPSVHLR